MSFEEEGHEMSELTIGKIEFSPMTASQEHHLASLKLAFSREFDAKYRNGQREHGGNLFEMTPLDLIRNLKQEALDLWAYACTLEDQLIEAELSKPHHGA